MDTFTVEVSRTVTLTEGWAAWFMPLWDDGDTISTVESGVARVSPDTVRIIGGAPCVKPEGESWWLPCADDDFATDELAYDDTHDLRNRLFADRASAQEHVRETLRQFANAQPWESSVRV